MPFRLVPAATLAWLALGGAVAAPTYRITLIDLPPELGSVVGSTAVRINDAGVVAGSVKLAADPRERDWRAYGWTAAAGFEISADKPWSGRVFVRSIDAAGNVAALVERDGIFDRIDPADPLRDQLYMITADAINSAGQIVGWGRVGERSLNYLLTPIASRRGAWLPREQGNH